MLCSEYEIYIYICMYVDSNIRHANNFLSLFFFESLLVRGAIRNNVLSFLRRVACIDE